MADNMQLGGPLCALLLGLLCACSGSERSTPATMAAGSGTGANAGRRADAERVLNIFNWSDYIAPGVVADFEKEFGIKVNYDVYDSNEVLETRLLTGHSNYDVVVPTGYFLENQIKAGVYLPLDATQLPNLKNLDPEVAHAVEIYEPGHSHAVDYMWLATTGIVYDREKLRKRPTAAPVGGWQSIFDPALVAKYRDCGVALIDSPVNVVSSVLFFLGKDPNSESLQDLDAVQRVLLSVRPAIRYIETTRIDTDLANGEICMAIDWSAGALGAQEAAVAARNGVDLAFVFPEQGAISNFDLLAIPADAPHPRNAHSFINYLLRPDVAARNSTYVRVRMQYPHPRLS